MNDVESSLNPLVILRDQDVQRLRQIRSFCTKNKLEMYHLTTDEEVYSLDVARRQPWIVIDLEDTDINCEELLLFASNWNSVVKIGLTFTKPNSETLPSFVDEVANSYQQLEELLLNLSAQQKSSTGVIDKNMLSALLSLEQGSSDSFFETVLRTYLTRAPQLLNEILNAIQKSDSHALERLAHSLKGSSGNLGAVHLMRICEELEASGRARNLDSITQDGARLVEAFHTMLTELFKTLKELNWPRAERLESEFGKGAAS